MMPVNVVSLRHWPGSWAMSAAVVCRNAAAVLSDSALAFHWMNGC